MTHDPREALKPCPFCGGEAKIFSYRTSEDSEGVHIECIKCGVRTDATDDAYADRLTAVSMWNTRALTASPGEQKPPPAAGIIEREIAAQSLLARVRHVRDGYANQAKFADVDPASYFREFVRRLDDAVNPKPSTPPWNGKALRREAPAPDGVKKIGQLFDLSNSEPETIWDSDDRPDAGGGVREQLAEALAENKALRAANTQLVLAERDRIEAALSTPPAAVPSNASVEARLREALKLLISDIEDYERVTNLAPSPGKNDCWQSVTRAKEALSAVGDEEKKSEGAPAREPGMGWELSDETKARLAEIDDNLRNAAINASNIVAGNPSSPTAERREIVARKCADDLTTIIEAAVKVAHRTGNTFVIDRQKVAIMIRGHLAALDGGAGA